MLYLTKLLMFVWFLLFPLIAKTYSLVIVESYGIKSKGGRVKIHLSKM